MAEKKKSSSSDGPQDHFAAYRGAIRGLDAIGSTLVFSTEHPEGQSTGVYEYDLAKKTLRVTELDCGVTAQLLVDQDIWLGCTDLTLRSGKLGKKPATVGSAFDARIVALAPFVGGVAVVAGDALHLTDAKGGRQSFNLGEPGRSVASDATGTWIVVGTTRGHLCVFNNADGKFVEVSRTRLHDGEVTALAFDPDELRVYSAGSDCRLLLSFVRGALDTEDRGGNEMHEREATQILIGPDFVTADGTNSRFYTSSLDSNLKAWPRGRGGRQSPASQGRGVVQTSAIAIVELDGAPHLAAAGLDATIRVFEFEEKGRIENHVITLRDAYALAASGLRASTPKAREAALGDLAGYADLVSLKQLSAHVSGTESDHKLQVRGVELLAAAKHRQVATHLESFFSHSASDVRVAAYLGLRKVRGTDDIDVLRRATTSGQEDLGLHGVRDAAALASDASIELVKTNLNHGAFVVRYAALTALEGLYPKTPQGTLLGLKASQADIRRVALSRVLERGLLGTPAVDAQLRRMWDDQDDRARLLSFAVTTHRQPNLVKALRAVDEDFHRQVFELEQLGKDEKKRVKDLPKAAAFDSKKLTEQDFRPLLEAMGSRSVDVSLLGARGLAALGDTRAFGTLLQLSRESSSTARIAVCKALGVLGDPRCIKRIRAMLHDSDDQVRDAAFSALTALQPDDQLATAHAGLSASALNVRERALALLVKAAKAQKKGLSDQTRKLLVMALNDSEPGLRGEAFKSVLNLAPDGAGPPTLRFILQSSHANIRNEVLQEAKAKPKEADYRAVMLELIDDADDANRTEALLYALDKWPSKEHVAVFRAALGSRHAAQRAAAVRKLSEQKGEIRSLLVEALRDEDTSVRLEAVRALVQAENRALLADAVASEHLDVRVEAASALAVLGDVRSLKPLIEVIDGYHALIARKANADDVEAYVPRLQSALTGLQHLGHPESIDAVLTLFKADTAITNAAAATLPSIAHPSNLDKVRALADHENPHVRLLVGLALAYNGDASLASSVFGKTGPAFELFAALGLRADSPERLLSYVDSDDARTSQIALALVLALELTEHAAEGVPERCLSLLSAKNGFVRLKAAEALENYGEQPAFYAWVYAMLNGMSSPPDAWTAEPRKLLVLSRAITLGQPRLAVRAGQVLAQLVEPKADEFERQFRLFEDRFKEPLADLEKLANSRKAAPMTERVAQAWHRMKAKAKSLVVEPTSFDEGLHALAFGAYVGLTRQKQDHHDASIHLAAIAGLSRLAPASDRFRADAISVLLLTLGDPTGGVRERAFDVLLALGASPDVLSTEALSTGYPDMGLRGLELLASDKKGGNALLEQTLLESTNGLEDQAAKLLTERVGQIAVYRIGLGAASETFRSNSVRGLSREAANSPDALKALRGALDSGLDDVRFLAARELAAKKDALAYDTLVEMLDSEEDSHQRDALSALQRLRDKRAPGALIDRVANDTNDTANVSWLLNGAVTFDDPSIAERLIAFIDADKHRSDAFEAAHELSGYKQFEWMDDEDVARSDPKWVASLKPRHPDVFGALFDLAYRIADHDMLGSLVGQAKWPAQNDEIDRTLGALLTFSHEHIRHRCVEILGWRLRHRGAPADRLKSVLTSKDPLDQFYAAEGLALAGHNDGLTVLRAAVDAMDDWSLRERAVLAVGVLADPSTVDMLLAMANDEMHDMREPAAEAIGHMSGSARADEVFATLRTLASDDDTQDAAFKGLRWFGTPGAWDILRTHAESDDWSVAQQCVELLRFDDGSKDLVAKVLRENDDWDVAESAAASLRHMWGPDSLEPDYLVMQACIEGIEAQDEAFDRLREKGDVGRILDVMSKVHEDNVDEIIPKLTAIVLGRDPLPIDAVVPLLSSAVPRTAALAAQILGRGGEAASKAHGKTLAAATTKARTAWLAAWEDFVANRRGAREKLTDSGLAYRRLVWACGQLQVAKDELLAAAKLPDHEIAFPIREDALASLGESWIGKDGVTTLVALARGQDARLRSMAAAELDRCAPAESAKLLGESSHDDVSFGRLLNSLDPKAAQAPLRAAVKEAAGIALPRLAAIGDIAGLTSAMRNLDLTDGTRRGAIDALATMASAAVAKHLAEFGADEKQDELLRKAAWRARRRVTRAVAAQEAP